ncbi:MAG: heavy metal translocating P-type ATPase [Dehalococcoidales bacterium]|nr:heavy metal translocating P-type ATPase [Dehalococcoidales bacterium]
MELKEAEIAVNLPPNGECERCLERLRDSVGLIKGVDRTEIQRERCMLTLAYDPELASLSRIEDLARDLGAGIAQRYAHETLAITDMDCADCAAKLETAIGRMPGVLFVAVNFAAGTMRLEYEAERISRDDIVARIEGLGYGIAEPPRPQGALTSEFRLSGLDCADCAVTIERNLSSYQGVANVRVDYGAAKLVVTHQPSLRADDIVHVVERSGYGAVPLVAGRKAVAERPYWVRNLRALLTAASGIAVLAGFALGLLEQPSLYSRALYALAMVLGGYHIARSGLYGLIRSRTLDMNVLMTIAALGAVAIGEWAEGATVVFLFALGNALEGYTMDRARNAIRALMELAPNQARVKRAGGETSLPVEEVRVGEVVMVRPGEKIPLDGRVVSGSSSVNQAPITGESVPVEKAPGDEVFAGTINERGYLEIEVGKPYAENTIARIIQMVEEAQAQRAPSQRFVDRFARYYTPAVIAIAAATAIVPWLIFGQPFDAWFYRALVLLVIACPCALVISTPVSIVSGIARGARLGVLLKGGAYLEEAGSLRVVAFDKTGTLTVGRPEVTDIIPLSTGKAMLSPDEVLHLAAAVEARSEHPLAAAVLRRFDDDVRNGRLSEAEQHAHEVADFEAAVGKGVRARVDGDTYCVGSPRLFEELGVPLAAVEDQLRVLREDGKTVLLLGTERELVGVIAVADRLRPGAKAAVTALRKAGIERVVLLTGDHEETAQAVARAVGADEYRAGLLPEDKVAAVKELKARYGKVAMVGDGVNDAPALAASTVGIAMGVAGTDAALETADIALMVDDLSKVAYTIALSRRALATIHQNIVFSLATKAAFLALTFPGWVTLWLAILADTGASLLVTLNGMRLLGYGGAAPSESGRTTHTAHSVENHAGPGCDCGHQHNGKGHERGLGHRDSS